MPSKARSKPDESTEDASESQANGAELPKPDKFVEIPFKGIKFVIPRDRDDWSIEALAWLSEGKNNLFVKYTLEIAKQGQWEALTKLCPRRRDFAAFYSLFAKATDECVN
jgi:hypothetical protein